MNLSRSAKQLRRKAVLHISLNPFALPHYAHRSQSLMKSSTSDIRQSPSYRVEQPTDSSDAAAAPPPAYSDVIASKQASTSYDRRTRATLLSLPDHLLLSVISLLPISTIAFILRPLNHRLESLSFSLLKSHYLPFYKHSIKAPHTSSPFTGTREAKIFSSYCLAKSWSENEKFVTVLATNSELGLSEKSGLERDVFDHLQPIARLEDLVIQLLGEKGLLMFEGASGEVGRSSEANFGILENDLKLGLEKRKAKLYLPMKSASLESKKAVDKLIFEVVREEGELLEKTAKRIVRGIEALQTRMRRRDDNRWYEWI